MGQTSANSSPARIIFVRSRQAKERLRPALSEGNLEKTMAVPMMAIIGFDLKFYDRLPELFPHNPEAGSGFADDPKGAKLPLSVTALCKGRISSSRHGRLDWIAARCQILTMPSWP